MSVALVSLTAAPAIAAWKTTGTGSGGVTAATLAAPAAATAAAASASSVAITATGAPASGPTPSGYRVIRVVPSVGVPCTALALNATCSDTGRASNTSYVYGVKSELANWLSPTLMKLGPVTYSGFYAATLSLSNGGSISGQLEKGDVVTVAFSQLVQVSSVCSTWTAGDGSDQAITSNNVATATVTDNGAVTTGNDALTVTVTTSACGGSLHFGTVDLGSKKFVSGGNLSFGGTGSGTTDITYTVATKSLAIKLGTRNIGAATVGTDASSVNIGLYTPDTAIKQTGSTPAISGNRGVQGTLF